MPDDCTATLEEGKTLFDNRRFDDAIDKFRQALRQNPACSDACYYLGRSFLEKRQDDEAAREFCEAIRKNPADADSRYWLAGILLDKKNAADATALLYEAMRMEPGLLHHFLDQIVRLLQSNALLQKRRIFSRTVSPFLQRPLPLPPLVPMERVPVHASMRPLASSTSQKVS